MASKSEKRRAEQARRDAAYRRALGGESFTYRAALDEVEAVARGLRALGVTPGDRVGLMCDNRAEVVWAWLGVNAARAIDVPFNAEARGRLLAYFVDDAQPKVLIGTEGYLKVLADTVTHDPEVVVCIGEHTSAPFGDRTRQLTFEELSGLGRSASGELEDPRAGEIATIM